MRQRHKPIVSAAVHWEHVPFDDLSLTQQAAWRWLWHLLLAPTPPTEDQPDTASGPEEAYA